jgi:hypothetical protein
MSDVLVTSLDVNEMSTGARNQPQPESPKSTPNGGIGGKPQLAETVCAEMVRRGSTVRVR